MIRYAMIATVRFQVNAVALKKSPLPTRRSSTGGQSGKSAALP